MWGHKNLKTHLSLQNLESFLKKKKKNNNLFVSSQVSMLPENDRWSETRSQLLAQMDVSMGGRVAEEIIFGPENITTGIVQHITSFVVDRSVHWLSSSPPGASSDFDSATKIAKLMVTRFGMCEKVGNLNKRLTVAPVTWSHKCCSSCLPAGRDDLHRPDGSEPGDAGSCGAGGPSPAEGGSALTGLFHSGCSEHQ